MNLKNKFHLTLVILITIAQSVFGMPAGIIGVDPANALMAQLDIKNQAIYNQDISNIYNNINIKYISIRLYNINIKYNINNKKMKLSNLLSFKEKVEILMYSIKQVESNGRYDDRSRWSDACGAYQYMPVSWDDFKGFKTACLAPEWAQDAKMRGEIISMWNKFHDWEKVIASHYMPSYAYNKSLWNKHYFAGQPTIRQYVQNVKSTMNSVMVGLATT